MHSIAQWRDFFSNNNINDIQQVSLLGYIDNLNKKSLPIIFDFNHLSMLIGIQPSILAKLVSASSFFYREFDIPKKSGGHRTISAPYPILVYCQKWIFQNILSKISITDQATAFRKKSSIIANAKMHLNSNELLKIDLKDFFNFIDSNRINNLFQELGYSRKVSHYLTAICCKNNCIAQGACTSPILSNIISISLDHKLNSLTNEIDAKYSRYADDISISGSIIDNDFIKKIYQTIESEGFYVNEKKTSLKKEKQRKIITGLIVSNKLNTPKKYRREFRKKFHFLTKNGVNEFNGHNGLFDPLYIDKLLGQCNYILSVTPNSQFYIKAKAQLSTLKQLYITKT